jgi:hypothetical protein
MPAVGELVRCTGGRWMLRPSQRCPVTSSAPADARDKPHNTPDNPNPTGQPNQSLESQPSHPAGFETAGFANAESHYAGSQPQNSRNPKSVSRYDVAAFQFSNRGPNGGPSE